ncbi:hypothetical protein JYT91_00985 [archaeon AH-315-M20]|nr:hypothetical protein [archaeon AH-315-M20]
MMGCKKCMAITGVLFLVLGIIFLLVDLGMWDFWNIQWWTALFLVIGVVKLAMNKCPDCQAMKTTKKK